MPSTVRYTERNDSYRPSSTVLSSPYADPYRPCDREGRRLYGEPQSSRSTGTPCFTPGQMLDAMMSANSKPAYERSATAPYDSQSLSGSRIVRRELHPRTVHHGADVIYETVRSVPERHHTAGGRFLSSDGTTRLISSTAPVTERVRTISNGRVVDDQLCVPTPTTTLLHQALPATTQLAPAAYYPQPPAVVVPTIGVTTTGIAPNVLVAAPPPPPPGYVPVYRDPVPTVIPLRPPPQRERVVVLPPPPPADPYGGYWCGYWDGWSCGQQWAGQGAGGWNGWGGAFGNNARNQGGQQESNPAHQQQPHVHAHQHAHSHAHAHSHSHPQSHTSCDGHHVNRQPLVVAKDGKVFEYVHNPKAGGTRLVEHGVLPVYGRSLTTSGAARAEIYVQAPREAP